MGAITTKGYAPSNLTSATAQGCYGIVCNSSSLENGYPVEGKEMYGVLLVLNGYPDLISQLLLTTAGRWTRSGTKTHWNTGYPWYAI